MGIWGKIVGFFVGNSKASDALIDTATDLRGAIDVLVLTDEEKVQYQQKSVDQILEFQRLNKDQSSDRSKARRDIAKLIVRYQLFMTTIIGVAYYFDKAYAEFLLKLNVEMKIALAFFSVIIFYFGYYGATKIVEKFKK